MYPIHLNNYFSTLPFDILLASSLLITVLARVQILFIYKRLLKGSMSFELLIKKMKRLVAYLAKAYPGFPSINWWEVSLPPPPPWMGYQSIAGLPSSIHQASLTIHWYPFVLTVQWEGSVFPKLQHIDPARSQTHTSQCRVQHTNP